ncbi:BamA/TamA family outer membrane protein [Aureispira anguillae]|uniref:BamA/TamA family outer membrane protein n=1 Tax=Aureispira anguillae TaxID=2864201 RepID=A0A915YIJ4_9BACT|nr:BamA/TamA family outer membrane protein [Aureispira anguillae]BDS13847.1 BamA/TamA family outer membrane protein [Aureispira anguillae]
MIHRLFLIGILVAGCIRLVEGQISKVCIQSIDIIGYKKTKTTLIENELNISVGDSIPLEQLMPKLEQNKRFLVNTLLFNHVEIKILKWEEQNVHLLIVLKESWYIFPLPQFELADRNFNVWWTRHNRDIRRANLGMWLVWRNLTGYNDLLKVIVQFGYTRKFELDYTLPPMGQKRKFGFNINALYSDNKEIAYNTINNKLAFYNNFDISERQFQRIRGRFRGYYRRTLLETQQLELSFLQLSISDSIAAFNPHFFLGGNTVQRSFNLTYTYTLDKRDIRAYPLNGYYVKAILNKQGLGIFNDINQLQLTAHFGHYMQIGQHLSVATQIKGRYSFIRSQMPYNDNRALGFNEDFVRGYQYYVINGQDFLLVQSDINFKVLDVSIPLFRKFPISYLQALPLKIHLRYHLDLGYVWDRFYAQANHLSNTDLLGTGIGVDLIFYSYNIIVQFEYTFNKNGEKGLYLRYRFNF